MRSYRKNMMANKSGKDEGSTDQKPSTAGAGAFVKVSMDGAPYLRKVDLKVYNSYDQLSDALGKMFSSFTMGKHIELIMKYMLNLIYLWVKLIRSACIEGNYGAQEMIDFMNESKLMDLLNSSEYVPTYEDKDGDWMLVGDVPWE